MAVTKHRTIRVDDELWDAFHHATGDRTVTDVLKDFMAWYVRVSGVEMPERPPVQQATS